MNGGDVHWSRPEIDLSAKLLNVESTHLLMKIVFMTLMVIVVVVSEAFHSRKEIVLRFPFQQNLFHGSTRCS